MRDNQLPGSMLPTCYHICLPRQVEVVPAVPESFFFGSGHKITIISRSHAKNQRLSYSICLEAFNRPIVRHPVVSIHVR